MSTLIKKEGKWVRTSIGDASMSFVRKPAWSQAETVATLPFTAPKDGILMLQVGTLTASQDTRTFYINGVEVAKYSTNGVNINTMSTISIPVNQGDILTSDYGIWGVYKFVPFEDSLVDPVEVTPEYIRNQNILSDYEAVTIASFTAQYDGIINFMSVQGASGSVYVLVNNVRIADMGSNNVPTGTSCGFSTCISVKKGDIITFEFGGSPVPTVTGKARWYKLRDYRGR